MNIKLPTMITAVVVSTIITFTHPAFGHGKNSHDKKPQRDGHHGNIDSMGQHQSTHSSIDSAPSPDTEAVKKINQEYTKTIVPIFAEKCLSCHGEAKELPWYAVIPGPKQLIEHDMEEAKEHLDMSNGFPFGGHGGLIGDLSAVKESAESGSMPPFRYLIMHWSSSLTDSEKETVIKWADDGIELLTP